MRPLILPAVCLLAACSPPAAPDEGPALSFSADGGAYAWNVANGARGGLILSRQTATEGRPVLVIACDNLRTGELQARLFKAEPTPTPLTLTAGGAVMTVPARPGQVGDQPVLEGEGDLPSGVQCPDRRMRESSSRQWRPKAAARSGPGPWTSTP